MRRGRQSPLRPTLRVLQQSRLAGRLGHPLGDNRTGAGDGNDEVITVNLPQVPAGIHKIVFAVSIIRVVNAANGAEMVRYDLTEVYESETALVFGELYRKGEQWKSRAVGQGFDAGLAGIAGEFGVNV